MKIIAILCLLGLVLTQSPPIFPPQFTIDFN